MEKIALLVDVQNIYYTTRQAFNRQFNYRAFWAEVTRDRELVAAYAYAIESRDGGKQAGFQHILRDIGFVVKLKPFIQRGDGSAKGDWDVGIVLDMLELAEQVDTVVLASGDGDFDLALQRIKERYDVGSEVYGVERLTAGSLIRSAQKYIPIEESLLMPQP
ncbi:MAG: NYN domain-containing protein [Planctomycetota bacterium]